MNPLISEYRERPWVMRPAELQAFIKRVAMLQVESLADITIQQDTKPLQVVNGIAMIRISGVLLKTVPSWAKFYMEDVTGYDDIERQLAGALSESRVKGIHLSVCSPGGMVAGVEAAADAIRAAGKVKPVTATVEDLCASGAYWLASQAQSIRANRTAQVGSIGVFTYAVDFSKAFEKEGIRVVVIRSGEHKGMGLDEITDEQVLAVQDLIDNMAGIFVDYVATGRNRPVSDIRELATGRSWIAAAAKEIGLIDAVEQAGIIQKEEKTSKGDNAMDGTNEKEVFEDQAVTAGEEKTNHTESNSSSQNETAASAVADEKKRLSDLKAAFPDDLAFAVEQFEAGASVIEARAAYCEVLQKKLQEGGNKGKSGATPVEYNDSASAGGQDYIAAAKELAKDENLSMTDAFSRVAKERPELYEAYKSRGGSRS